MAEINFGLLNNDFTGQQEKAFNYGQQISNLANQRNAGKQYAAGDYGGAASTLASGGDIAGAQTIEQKQAALQQQQLDRTAKGQQYIAQALPLLKQIAATHAQDPDGGAAARGAVFDQIAAEAQQLTGASPQQLAAFKDSWVSDPQGTLSRLEAQIPTEYKTAGDSLLAFKNGQNVGQYTGVKTINAPATDNVYQIGGGGGPVQPQGSPQVAPGAVPATPSPQASISPTEADVQDYITKNIPGAIITSGQRTPVHNAEVGGVPNSMHIPGQAVDFVMPKGMSFDQIKQMVAQTGLQPTELLNEGSHVHLAWGPKPGAPAQAKAPQASPTGLTVLQRGQPAFRPPTDAEKAQYPGISQMGANGKAEYPPLSAVGASLSADQLQPIVDILKAGGTPSARVMNNPAVYAHVLQLAQDQGVTPTQILGNQANRKATQSTFANINTRYAMVQAQEQTFQKSLDLATQLVQKAGTQGGGTLINNFRNYLKTGVIGDPATGAAINAVSTAMNEYGKIIEGSTGNAGSSISARDDANHMLSLADNIPAFLAKLPVLKADAEYKIGSLKDQHDTLLKTLGGSVQDEPTPAPSTAGKTVIRYDAQGNRIK